MQYLPYMLLLVTTPTGQPLIVTTGSCKCDHTICQEGIYNYNSINWFQSDNSQLFTNIKLLVYFVSQFACISHYITQHH